MSSLFLLYPIHLFKDIKSLKSYSHVYLIEDPIYFTDYEYHKLKIAYHRATMKSYEDLLKKNKIKVSYFSCKQVNDTFYKKCSTFKKISCYQPYEYKLSKKLKKNIKNIDFLESLNFLVNDNFIQENKDSFCKKGKFNHLGFYKLQRQRFNILMNKDGTPKGGKWSFDEDNREKIPSNQKIPEILDLKYNKNKYIIEAKDYVQKHFSKNYGSLENFIYPLNHEDSKKWLKDFIKTKFKLFGPYEDAETMRNPFLFHSVLTPMMNIGLLTDSEVLDVILPFENKIPLPSFEGFIRQIIGWRNYILTIYILEGENIKKMNFMNHKNSITKKIMWSGSIDILPFDNIIKKINNYAYAHHIERLMYLGNFLFLLQIKPNDVFKAFMEWTIDAYDWVMVANVYCMSQHADGGLIMNKPYFSSSNYILKMSDYKKEEWCSTWNDLYYHFINTHQKYLKKNYSWARHVAFWNKKPENEKKDIIKNAKAFMKKLCITK